jgi:hypothetical protein
MMETNTESTATGFAASIRPTFLTVLCILTFIGSGWGVYKGFSGYFTADFAASVISETQSQVNDKLGDKEQPAFLKNMMGNMFSSLSADNIKKMSIISLISNIFTLIGAIVMWGLRKQGFYLYVVGIGVSVVGSIVVFGGGLIGLVSGGGAAFFGIMFSVLYGLHLKYMTRK